MRKITFTNKVENQGATYTGKAWAADFNEIKEIVNVSPQETAIAPNLTVKENLDFMAGVYKIKNKNEKMRAGKIRKTRLYIYLFHGF